MAYKVFSNGDALTGSELNTYLMNQSVMVFATATARDAALTTPSEGMVVWLQDANKYVYYTGSAWADLITPASSGNAIINGAFDIWQRGSSVTLTSALPSYGADRFYATCNFASGSATITKESFTPGTAPVADYEGSFFQRITNASGGSYWETGQKIEDVRTYAGQAVTVSFWAKSSSAQTATLNLYQNFGSGGSSAVSHTTTVSITTSWTRFTFSTTLGAMTGKTIGTSSWLGMLLYYASGTVASSTVDIWGVQLESGSSAKAFKRNAPSIQGEIAACQRYLPVYEGNMAAGYAYGTNTSTFAIPFPVTARTSPTSITVLSNSDVFALNTSTSVAVTIDGASVNGANVLASHTITAGQGARMMNGRILFNGCEL